MEFSIPSIVRLVRKAGIKSMSEDCHENILKLIDYKFNKIIQVAMIMNSEKRNVTFMTDDIINALKYYNENITYSNDLGINPLKK